MAFWNLFGKKKTPQELLVAGDLKGALKGFKALIKEKKQTDPALLMQLANVQTKMGKLDDAKATYIRVGEHYGDAGFFNKSVAAFKKALNLFPDDQMILDKLASYNDKVPKFMIDERFLRKINRWEEEHASGSLDPEEVEAARRAYVEGLAAEAGDALIDMDSDDDALPGETDLRTQVGENESAGQANVDIDMGMFDSDADDSFDLDSDQDDVPGFEDGGLDFDFDGAEGDAPARPERVTGPVIPEMDVVDDPYGFTRDDDEDDPQAAALAEQQPDFALDDEPESEPSGDHAPVRSEVPADEKARTLAGVEAFKAALADKDADTGQLHAARAAYEPTDIDDSGNRMVFKAAIEEAPTPTKKAESSYESVDDALDSLFGGAGGGDDDDGGLFGNLGPAPQAEAEPEPEPEPEPVAVAPVAAPAAEDDDDPADTSMTSELHFLDDEDEDFVNPFEAASEEENQRHWALFRTMPKEVFTAFVVALDMREYEPGEYLVRQGDEGREMFLLSEGRVVVEIEKEGDLVPVAELGEGDLVGEASLLTGAPRNASVRADEPTTCLILSGDDLTRLTKDHPSVMESIKSIYYTRVSQNASRFSPQEQTQA